MTVDETALAAGRLIDLARDWQRYGELASPEWRQDMRRAVVIEMRLEVHKLALDCELDPPPLRRRWWKR